MQYAESLMRHLAGDDVDFGNPRPEIMSWLESISIPIDLKRMLQYNWPKTPVTIGNIDFTDTLGMFHFDHRDDFIGASLFPLGSGLNGDPFLIDFAPQSQAAGFFCREEFDGDVRAVFQPTFRTLASYLHRVMLGQYLPFDYYDAKSMAEFLREESEHEPFYPFRRIR